MALVDAGHGFRVVHIGDYGRPTDQESVLGRGLEAGPLNVP